MVTVFETVAMLAFAVPGLALNMVGVASVRQMHKLVRAFPSYQVYRAMSKADQQRITATAWMIASCGGAGAMAVTYDWVWYKFVQSVFELDASREELFASREELFASQRELGASLQNLSDVIRDDRH